jgi:WD40 repeat protein
MFALGLSDGRIQFIDRSSGVETSSLTLGPGGSVTSLAFSPDGLYLAAGYADTSIAVWNFTMGFPQGVLTGHTSPVLSLAFAADNRTLASGSADGNIFLWDVSTMRSTAGPFSRRASQVTALAFHPGGRYLFAGSGGGSVDYWLVNPFDWRDLACLRAGRNLTPEEFNQYFPGQPYRQTCTDRTFNERTTP